MAPKGRAGLGSASTADKRQFEKELAAMRMRTARSTAAVTDRAVILQVDSEGPSAQGPHKPAPTRDEIALAFGVFDKDRSGTLTIDELIGVLTSPATGTPMTAREAKVFIGKFDSDADGKLDLAEFTNAMCKPPAKKAAKPKPAATIEPHMVCEKGGEHVFAFGKCTKMMAAAAPPSCTPTTTGHSAYSPPS